MRQNIILLELPAESCRRGEICGFEHRNEAGVQVDFGGLDDPGRL